MAGSGVRVVCQLDVWLLRTAWESWVSPSTAWALGSLLSHLTGWKVGSLEGYGMIACQAGLKEQKGTLVRAGLKVWS